MNYRPLRVSKLIRGELARIVEREIEFGENILVTITDVEVNKKLEHAKVGVSVIPEHAGEKVLKMLRGAAPRLQYLLVRKINIKPMPRIEFFLDRGSEHAANIEKILIKEQDKP